MSAVWERGWDIGLCLAIRAHKHIISTTEPPVNRAGEYIFLVGDGIICLMGKKKKGKSLTKVIPANEDNLVKFSPEEDNILWVLAEGRSPMQVAKQLAPDDKKKQSAIRRRTYRLFARVDMQDELAARLKLIQILGLGPAVKALNRKAAAGRVDAIKLAFESSGFHNPRIQHEHGGEVTITIKNAPRPDRVVEEYARDNPTVVDAEVVE